MPTKDDFHFQHGIISLGDESYEINAIDPCTLDSEHEIIRVSGGLIKPSDEFTVEFDCNFNGMTVKDFFLVAVGICTQEQITQNNWRKTHGLPMRRRRRKMSGK